LQLPLRFLLGFGFDFLVVIRRMDGRLRLRRLEMVRLMKVGWRMVCNKH
jgi:hypothetical protein